MTRPKTKILVDGGDPQGPDRLRNCWDLSMDRPPTLR